MASRKTTARKSAAKKSTRKRAKTTSGREPAAKKSGSRKASAGKRTSKTTAQKKVKKAMHERKEGTLRSGGSGKKVTSKKQAIAIGLSEARKAGAKVPKKKSGSQS